MNVEPLATKPDQSVGYSIIATDFFLSTVSVAYVVNIKPTFCRISALTGNLFADDVQALVHGSPGTQLLLVDCIQTLTNSLHSCMSVL